MGVGAEADSDHPHLRETGSSWGYHLGWSGRPAVGSSDPGWHAATDGATDLPVAQLGAVLDIVVAIQAGTAPPSAIHDALLATAAAPAWQDAINGATMAGQCGEAALHEAAVRGFARLLW